jgi:HK97 family phage prohead protease
VSDKAVNFLIDETAVKVFGHVAVLGDQDIGDGITEEITREAFEQALAEPNVRLLYNFDGPPLDSDLYLKMDEQGLFVYATLDPKKENTQRLRALAVCAAEKGEALPMEFGFSFRALEQDWDHNYSRRVITKLKLISVSILAHPDKRAL